jgi:hypothetical protein
MDDSFNIVECRENREALLGLYQLVEDGNAILFVGSGCSRRLSYPSWEQTLSLLVELVDDTEIKKKILSQIALEEFLLAAEIVKASIPVKAYDDFYKETFKPKIPSYDNLHVNLMSLKFKGFVTTNYDPILLGSLANRQGAKTFRCDILISSTTMPDVHRFIKSISSRNWDNRCILYAHGYHMMPETRILSYGEYVEKYSGIKISELPLYGNLIRCEIDIETFEKRSDLRERALRSKHYNTLYTLLATQRVVYLGYGLRDPFLHKVTSDITSDFQIAFDDFHYVIFRITESELASWTKEKYDQERDKLRYRGIVPIFYLDNVANTGLDLFIDRFPPQTRIPEKVYPEGGADSQYPTNSSANSQLFLEQLKHRSLENNKKERQSEN